MSSPWIAAAALIVFILAAGLGMRIRLGLKEHHKSTETMDLLRVTVTMLVTFAAIVLGLLITSSKTSFDLANSAVHSYSAALMDLDEALANAGPAAGPIRRTLVRYTAGVIASTWTTQPPPQHVDYPRNIASSENGIIMESLVLGRILRTINEEILRLPDQSQAQSEAKQECLTFMGIVWQQRWILINASDVSLSTPFLAMLVFWIFVIFLCLGLCTPFNALSSITIVLGAVAIASALFVIIDLNGLYSGSFMISSTPMRGVLTQMLHD